MWGKNHKEEFIMKMRKGFTLVELLIVIIIIGILAAAILLSSGSASDSAMATKAISEMRSIKAAVISYAAERAGSFAANAFEAANIKNTVGVLMDSPDVVKYYKVEFNKDSGSVDITPDTLTTTAMQKVKDSPATDANGTMSFRIPKVK